MLVDYGSEFFALALIHFLAVAAPGPDFTVTIRQSVSHGRTSGMVTSLGIGAGLAVHVTYTLLGIGFLIAQSAQAFFVAKLIGAIYLLYLGIKLLQTKKNVASLEVSDDLLVNMSASKAFFIGFMTNVLNPKATLFFLAVFTTVVSADTPLFIQVFYGLWMCLVNILWFALVSVVFSHRTVRQQFLNMGHWFERLMGGVLIGFATKLALSFR